MRIIQGLGAEIGEVRKLRERRARRRGELAELEEELGEGRKGKGLEAGRGKGAGW